MALLYRSLVFADSPLTLTAANLDVINSNQNALIIDANITLGTIVINLPSITSLLYGAGARLNGAGALTTGAGIGAGGFSFYINGNIVAQDVAGANQITFNPYRVNTAAEVDLDVICGLTNAIVGGVGHDVGTCFQLFITGRHSWCILQCVAHGS